jgi:hypothetical protein
MLQDAGTAGATSIGRVVTRARLFATAAVEACLVAGRVVAAQTTATRARLHASGAAFAAGVASALSNGARRAAGQAQAAGGAWVVVARAFGERVGALRLGARVGVESTVHAPGRPWNRRAVVAPAIGVLVVAGAATASTALVMSRWPGSPASRAPSASVTSPARELPPASVAMIPSLAGLPAPAAVVRPVVARVKSNDEVGAVANAPTPAISANTIRALWLKTDTRSLDRALSTVRQATLAFRSCTVQVTATDQAVARCDLASAGDRPASAWTIDFSRSDERWRIDGISEARSGRPRR